MTDIRRLLVCLTALVIVGGIAAGALFAASHPDSWRAPPVAGPTVPSCPTVAPTSVGTITIPAGPITEYCQDRLIKAAYVITAARSLGIGAHTQATGVMTAMGESGFRNLHHGDAARADIRVLFQQRANGAWGTLTDRITPSTAAHNFFAAQVNIPGWKLRTPTHAAHAAQINADANFSTTYWDDAVAVVTAVTNATVPNG